MIWLKNCLQVVLWKTYFFELHGTTELVDVCFKKSNKQSEIISHTTEPPIHAYIFVQSNDHFNWKWLQLLFWKFN